MQQQQKPQFIHIVPTFAKGPLRTEILENMRDLPLVEQQLRYQDYSDGVLFGCHLYEENGVIGVDPGMVKFAERVYTLKKRVGVPYEATDDWTVLKIAFRPESSTREFIRFTAELVLDTDTSIKPNELELGRFKLKKGSNLRSDYKDFADMTTEFDTVHVTYVRMAGIGDDTLHPSITWNFGLEAYHYATDARDVAFASLCLLENRSVSRLLIQQYIFGRKNVQPHRLGNEELHRLLTEILQDIRNGMGIGSTGTKADGSMLLL